ncbi:MAG: DoxX family protein [Bacteroidales bacterium]|nr:DoxX family protein [Bacteroidales bacterium]
MKCKMIGVCDIVSEKLSILKDFPLLAMRIILAYGFWKPGMMKWKDIDSIASWFESMDYPLPLLNAYAAATTEVAGAILLLFGFAARLISIPLMVIMLVAIFTVHGANGFEAGNNGYEIPLYYLIMLFTITIYGGGRISVEGILRKLSK